MRTGLVKVWLFRVVVTNQCVELVNLAATGDDRFNYVFLRGSPWP
jgi:hypothetical protein